MTDLQPDSELDALFYRRVEGLSLRLVTDTMGEWVQDRILAMPGDYVINDPTNAVARLCPAISEDNGLAIDAIIRFADQYDCYWRVYGIPKTLPTFREHGAFGCSLEGGRLVYETFDCTLFRYGQSVAHAIVVTLLAAVELQEVQNGA